VVLGGGARIGVIGVGLHLARRRRVGLRGTGGRSLGGLSLGGVLEDTLDPCVDILIFLVVGQHRIIIRVHNRIRPQLRQLIDGALHHNNYQLVIFVVLRGLLIMASDEQFVDLNQDQWHIDAVDDLVKDLDDLKCGLDQD